MLTSTEICFKIQRCFNPEFPLERAKCASFKSSGKEREGDIANYGNDERRRPDDLKEVQLAA